MQKVVINLTKIKMMYRSPAVKWASSLSIVLKPGKAQFRIIVNLLAVNRFRIRHYFLISLLYHVKKKYKALKFFAGFDLFHSYWQIPIYPSSRKYQSCLTINKVSTYQGPLCLHKCSGSPPDYVFRRDPDWFNRMIAHVAWSHPPTIYYIFFSLNHYVDVSETLRIDVRLHHAKCVLFFICFTNLRSTLPRPGLARWHQEYGAVQEYVPSHFGCTSSTIFLWLQLDPEEPPKLRRSPCFITILCGRHIRCCIRITSW